MANSVTSNSKNKASKPACAIPNTKGGRVRRKADASVQPDQVKLEKSCINCGGPLLFVDETRVCAKCNTAETHELAAALHSVTYHPEDSDTQFVECPGASVLDPKTGLVIEGAEFIDHEDGSYEVKILKRQVFPPAHRKRRMVKREAFGKIRRCQACQDYTVRLRRREGVDFCVPSKNHPHRKQLKPVDFISHTERS